MLVLMKQTLITFLMLMVMPELDGEDIQQKCMFHHTKFIFTGSSDLKSGGKPELLDGVDGWYSSYVPKGYKIIRLLFNVPKWTDELILDLDLIVMVQVLFIPFPLLIIIVQDQFFIMCHHLMVVMLQATGIYICVLKMILIIMLDFKGDILN